MTFADALAATNRDLQSPGGAVEPIGLVLSFQNESTEVRDGCPFAFSETLPVNLKGRHRDLEGRGNVLFVDVMLGGELTIGYLRESESRTDILAECGTDGFIDDETELFEKENERGREVSEREDEAMDNLFTHGDNRTAVGVY